MTRYVLSATLSADDNFAPELVPNDQLATVDFYIRGTRHLRFGVGTTLKQAAKLGLTPSPVAVDLMLLAAMVYAADTRITRDKAQDRWTREIKLVVPVSSEGLWNESVDLVERILDFLTGDRWNVEFRRMAVPHSMPAVPKAAREPPYDVISLFSGGLDSLIGAIDLLEAAGTTPLFVSHGGAGPVSGPQNELFGRLLQSYPGRNASMARLRLGLLIPNDIFPGVAPEPSTRGRSFLFFALGVLSGSGLGRDFILRVPENGLISVNVPLDVTRLGSNSTRTTHPFYIHRWNELLGRLGIRGMVKNPYWDKTKGEMVRECANQKIVAALHDDSISCAHPDVARWSSDKIAHCGTCLPCLIRRASLLQAAWAGGDATRYRTADLAEAPRNAGTAEGEQIRGFQVALDRLASRPALANTLIYKPGPLLEDVDKIPELVAVYRRGMDEVRALVHDVETTSADG